MNNFKTLSFFKVVTTVIITGITIRFLNIIIHRKNSKPKIKRDIKEDQVKRSLYYS